MATAIGCIKLTIRKGLLRTCFAWIGQDLGWSNCPKNAEDIIQFCRTHRMDVHGEFWIGSCLSCISFIQNPIDLRSYSDLTTISEAERQVFGEVVRSGTTNGVIPTLRDRTYALMRSPGTQGVARCVPAESEPAMMGILALCMALALCAAFPILAFGLCAPSPMLLAGSLVEEHIAETKPKGERRLDLVPFADLRGTISEVIAMRVVAFHEFKPAVSETAIREDIARWLLEKELRIFNPHRNGQGKHASKRGKELLLVPDQAFGLPDATR